jgi:hypothetical protein
MGYKVFTIDPDFSRWDHLADATFLPKEPLQVIFTWSKAKLEKKRRTQTVTSCIIRQRLNGLGAGHTIENPNDESDQIEGFHWAFKRAVKSFLRKTEFERNKEFGEFFKRDVDKAFRKALWEARNGNN